MHFSPPPCFQTLLFFSRYWTSMFYVHQPLFLNKLISWFFLFFFLLTSFSFFHLLQSVATSPVSLENTICHNIFFPSLLFFFFPPSAALRHISEFFLNEFSHLFSSINNRQLCIPYDSLFLPKFIFFSPSKAFYFFVRHFLRYYSFVEVIPFRRGKFSSFVSLLSFFSAKILNSPYVPQTYSPLIQAFPMSPLPSGVGIHFSLVQLIPSSFSLTPLFLFSPFVIKNELFAIGDLISF